MCDWLHPTSKQLKRSREWGHVYVVVGRRMLRHWELRGTGVCPLQRLIEWEGPVVTPPPTVPLSRTTPCDTTQHFNTQLTTTVTDS